MSTRCPSCSARVPAGETICAECGTELVLLDTRPAATSSPAGKPADDAGPTIRDCADCGSQVLPDPNGLCPVCGAEMGASAAAAPGPASAANSDIPVIDEREFFREPPSLEQVRAAGALARRQAAAVPHAGSAGYGPPPAPPAPVPVPHSANPAHLAAAWLQAAPQWPDATRGWVPPHGGPPMVPVLAPPPAGPGRPMPLPADRVRSRFQGDTTAPPVAEPLVPPPAPAAESTATLVVEGGQSVFFDGEMRTALHLDVDELLIGRRDPVAGHYPEIDLTHLAALDPHISRRHARILRARNRWFVEDLCTNSATFLNDRAHVLNGTRHPLQDGDRIFISDAVAMTFRSGRTS